MLDSFRDVLATYAKAVRETLRETPPSPELALASLFHQLLRDALPHVPGGAGITVVAEFTQPQIGRPDVALKRAGAPAAAFIELKAPDKGVDPAAYKGHDKVQWERFQSLPAWALSNFKEIVLYRRKAVELETRAIVPRAALDPATADAKAAGLIASFDPEPFRILLSRLAQAEPPVATNAAEVAANLAHAARLVRDAIQGRLAELAQAGLTGTPLHTVRDAFRDVLYAHPKAAGYPERDFDELFAGAFAQTLAFGLLLAREATGTPLGLDAYKAIPETHQLLRGTVRVLTQEEVVADMGAGFDVLLGTVNATDPALLTKPASGRDPILYFYEDFLGVFDAEAKKRHGVFYTPVEVVRFQVAAMDRVLRDAGALGTDGLLDPTVTVLDPAIGTGTYAVACVAAAAERAGESGPGMVAPALRDLAGRLFGFELLIGPYAVAHYRLHHELAASGAPLGHRLNVYLADTLAEPVTAAPLGGLGFIGQPIEDERSAADRLKQDQPILAIIGNPPYRRLKEGETEELVGQWMSQLWDDLKTPVREEGWGGELNTFPDLYIAFWRWALWKLFESPGATGRGVLCFITNRTFLAGHPYAGLRKMLRERFDRIEIYDLRGDLRRGARAGVEGDEGVFAIQAGTAITLAWAGGTKPAGTSAEVVLYDAWATGAFSRAAKLAWLESGSGEGRLANGIAVERGLLDDMRPVAFHGRDWPSLAGCFVLRSSGMQTKRDDFVYGFSSEALQRRVERFLATPDAVEAAKTFHESRDRKTAAAKAIPFSASYILRTAYRPFDERVLYNQRAYGDFLRPELQAAWGDNNVCLYAMPFGTGAGPAAWCHALLPDYHAFRGSYGGYAFPLYDHRPLGPPHNFRPALLLGLAAAYGREVLPTEVFDAVLALLSARSYTARFAEDLEDTFPHVPFPREATIFDAAASLGADIRAVETSARRPGAAFTTAKAATAPLQTLRAGEWGDGGFALCADGSGRVEGVPRAVWDFAVSGYAVLPRWLQHRAGEMVDATMLKQVLDLCARIAELLDLAARADEVLAEAVAAPLTRAQIGLGEAKQ